MRTVALRRLAAEPIVAGLNLAAPPLTDHGVRYVRTTDISGPRELTHDAVRITPDLVGYADVQRGDLLVCRTGSLGTVLLFDEPENAAFAGYLVRVRPDRHRVDPSFLGYWSESTHAQHQIHAGAIRSTIDNFNATRIASLRVPMVSLGQQRVVAGMLDRESERIDVLDSAFRTYRSVLEEMLSTIVREAVSFLEHAPLKRGATVIDCKHRTAEYVDDGWPLISTREVSPGELVVDDATRRVSRADFDDLRGGGRDPRDGDIIYSRNATVGVAAYVAGKQEVCMGQDVVLITRRPRDSELLSFVLNWAVEDQVKRLSVGSTFTRINVSTLRELSVPHDEPERERAALRQIKDEFERVRRLQAVTEAARGRLAEYRDALITEAVTGQLDVTKVSEAQMDERLEAATSATGAS